MRLKKKLLIKISFFNLPPKNFIFIIILYYFLSYINDISIFQIMKQKVYYNFFSNFLFVSLILIILSLIFVGKET